MKSLSFFAICCSVAFGFLPSAADAQVVYPQPTGIDLVSTFPYSMTGMLLYSSGRDPFQGSGTVIRPKSVLTAAHNLWDEYGGWSTNAEFYRGQYGDKYLSRQYARRLYIFSGYSKAVRTEGAASIRAFSNDIGGMRFTRPVADGSHAGWAANATWLTGDAYKISLGYGAPVEGADLLKFTETTSAFYKVLGGFYESGAIGVESGMSGGPVFAESPKGEKFVSAVIVAGSDEPVATGIRIIDSNIAKFIRGYLP